MRPLVARSLLICVGVNALGMPLRLTPPTGFRLTAPPAITGGAFLLAASTAVNFGNYGFNVLAGRLLGPQSYGALASLVSLLSLVAVGGMTLQMVMAREVASDHAGHATAGLTRFATKCALLLTLAFAIASWPLQRFLELPSALPVAMVGVCAATSLWAGAFRGRLQGRAQFAALGLSMFADPVARLVAFFCLFAVGLRLMAGISAYAIGFLAACAVAAWLLTRSTEPSRQPPHHGTADPGRYTLLAGAAILGLSVFLYQVDTIVARAALPPEEAGLYAAGAIISRSLLFAGSTAPMIMLPLVAREHQTDRRVRTLALTFAFAVGVAGAGLVAFVVAPGVVIALVFGDAYEALGRDLPLLGLAMCLFTAANVGLNYLFATRSIRILIPLCILCAVQCLMLALFHDSVRQIAWVQISIMCAANLLVWSGVARQELR